jgi:hypothetical protein
MRMSLGLNQISIGASKINGDKLLEPEPDFRLVCSAQVFDSNQIHPNASVCILTTRDFVAGEGHATVAPSKLVKLAGNVAWSATVCKLEFGLKVDGREDTGVAICIDDT